MLENDSLVTRVIDRNVSQNASEFGRRGQEAKVAMDSLNCRNIRKPEQRSYRFQAVISMD